MKFILSLIIVGLFACKSKNTNLISKENNMTEEVNFVPDYAITNPHVLIYKTKANYNKLVPVLLSEDKSEIISYPHPQDLIIGDDYSLPIILEKDYLWDQRGINANIAFLNLTYQEYANLKTIPSLNKLNELIIDNDPLIELCDCGIKTEALTKDLVNKLIKEDKLKTTCKVLK